jgi:hypothetical protein
MPVPRREFMKLFGVSLGSLLLARCQRTATPEPTPPLVTCYTIMPPTRTPAMPGSANLAARERLRLCWLRFDELARKTTDGNNADENGGDPLGTQMIAEHRSALDALTALAEITVPVADLVQEAYAAAVYHVWRSNTPMTCYDMIYPDYAPESAESLVRQTEVLKQVAAAGTIDTGTMEKAQAALEHDLAFYALTDEDVQALYEKLVAEYHDPGETIPDFEAVELSLTPEVKAAAKFLLELLTGS